MLDAKIDSTPVSATAMAETNGIAELERQEILLKTGALQNAIFNSANFSSIATDEQGVIIRTSSSRAQRN